MKPSYFYILHLTSYILLLTAGCAKKEQVVIVEEKKVVKEPIPISALIQKKVEEKYVYRGTVYRDPFLPLTERRMASPLLISQGEAKEPNLGALTLKGLIRDKNHSIALLSSPEGSYIAKNGKLYDNLNRLVPNITAKIDKESVTLITADKFTKTYKLREESQ